MSTKRARGATLSLVAVTVLVLIVFGIACFFIAKLAGGGREVANATDAGALNIARQAMRYPSLPEEGDFALLTTSRNGNMSLINYNRAVAQTLLVAVNAQDESTPTAISHAQTVLARLNTIGSFITSKLNDPTQMETFFENLSTVNSTKMIGNGAGGTQFVDSAYKTAYMRVGGSTNVYFDPATFPANGPAPANLQVTGNQIVPGVAGMGNYMAGYVPLSVPGVGTVYGVPVSPGLSPHLVSLAEFKTSTQTFPSTPVNSFCAQSSAQEAKTGNFSGAIACSIVGTVKANPEVNEFAAAIPGGYIEIANYAGKTLPGGFAPTNNSANLFNNQLFYEPGLATADSNGSEVFGAPGANNTDSQAVNNMYAWESWAAAGGTGTQPSSTDGMYISQWPGQAGKPLSSPPTDQELQILKNMGNCKNCLDQLNSQGVLSGNCSQWLSSYANTFNPLPVNDNTWPGGSNYSVVDEAKADMLQAFQESQQSYTLPPEFADSGLGVYITDPSGGSGAIGSYGIPWPQYTGPMQQTGTIMQLLKQVNGQPGSTCGLPSMMASILQRAKQIKPGTTEADLEALFNATPCPMGSTLFLYRNKQGTGNLIVSMVMPPTKSTQTPDGSTTAQLATCSNSYDVMGTLVNTDALSVPAGMGGDDNLHRSPYMDAGVDLIATDHASFYLSSGYGNLLGQLKFSCSMVETSTGGGDDGPGDTGSKGGKGSSQVMN